MGEKGDKEVRQTRSLFGEDLKVYQENQIILKAVNNMFQVVEKVHRMKTSKAYWNKDLGKNRIELQNLI